MPDWTGYPRTVADGRGEVWACCESASGRPCAHERHMTEPAPEDMTVQYCAGGRDITGDFYAADDATEVRAWIPDGTCLGAVTRDDSGAWHVSASDSADWTVYADTAFDGWRQPLAVILAASLYSMPADL